MPEAKLIPEIPPPQTHGGPAIAFPPYAGWDGLWAWITEDDTKITFGPLGGAEADVHGNVQNSVSVEIENSDDDGFGEVVFDSGILTWFTPTTTGSITATVALRCAGSLTTLNVENEFGFSDSDIWYGLKVTAGVYAPEYYGRSMAWLWTNDFSGAPGNDFFGGKESMNHNPFAPGETVFPQLVVPGIHPAEEPVLLHFGVLAHAFVYTNDVSATVTVGSQWRIEGIALEAAAVLDSGPALNPV